ncbi:unnamed protein product [Cladocopium goreaui]|uniref:PLOD1-3-like GT domain-containing protein n=1 Tax=Cladocopium goreaui TaxID=2562237 RepID=A0A9P1FZ78_9DINO|nr:unnamed protein product [Cladocopium goreaui]
MFAGAINTSQTEHLHVPSQPSQPRRHVVPMQATVLAEGDTQVLMRKENVSEIDARSCTCTDVDLKGKKWSPGGLKKCVGNCKKVSKATEVNDCPKDWKIFSPRSKEDWETIISLDVIKDVLKPHLVVDITQDKNGCGGCTAKAMNSDEDGQSMWKTLDSSAWWLRASKYGEPNGDYIANCFLGLNPPTDANAIAFNESFCLVYWDCCKTNVHIATLEGDWKGTLDKLIGYWTYLKTIKDDDVIVFLDAFDVFPNGLDGHELLRRFFSFGTPVVIASEENIFPREVAEQANIAVEQMQAVGLGNASAPSRYLNAGGIIGMGWALRKMYDDVRENMAANNPHMLMAHADIVGHWFLHSYDQYELWRYFIRHVRGVEEAGEEKMVALDTEQLIFGSTVFQKENWPELLNDAEPGIATKEGKGHSIDVDVPLVFDAPQRVFETHGCSGRFLGRKYFPIFWHGHGPWKAAWEGLRNRLMSAGCLGEKSPELYFGKRNGMILGAEEPCRGCCELRRRYSRLELCGQFGNRFRVGNVIVNRINYEITNVQDYLPAISGGPTTSQMLY